MVLYPIILSQALSTTVPNFMLVSGIAQSGQNLALSRLANQGLSCLQVDKNFVNSSSDDQQKEKSI